MNLIISHSCQTYFLKFLYIFVTLLRRFPNYYLLHNSNILCNLNKASYFCWYLLSLFQFPSFLQYLTYFLNIFHIFFSASFRIGMPTPTQIERLNRNAFVSLTNDMIINDKIRINILANTHTLFLAPSNSTVAIINQRVIEILFANHTRIAQVIHGVHVSMDIYRNMIVVITEKSYFFFFSFTCCQYYLYRFPSETQTNIINTILLFLYIVFYKLMTVYICYYSYFYILV